MIQVSSTWCPLSTFTAAAKVLFLQLFALLLRVALVCPMLFLAPCISHHITPSHERMIYDKLGFAVWELCGLLTVCEVINDLLQLKSLAQSRVVYCLVPPITFVRQLVLYPFVYVPV